MPDDLKESLGNVNESGLSDCYSTGPWEIGKHGAIVSAEPFVTQSDFDYYGGNVVCESVNKKNAAMIAACPQMYEALKKAKDILICEFNYRTFMANFPEVEVAIRAAEGRSQFEE